VIDCGYHGPVTHRAATIETARLILRPFDPDDFDDLYAYQSRPDVARYLHWEARDRAQAQRALEEQCGETILDAEGKWLTFAVVWREVHRVVGEIGLKWLSEEHRQGETGFVFNPDYQGRGLATEAAEAMLALGFGSLGWHRIIGSCDARNHASARLMERIGMRQEAHFVHREFIKGEWTDELVFAILDQEWERAALRGGGPGDDAGFRGPARGGCGHVDRFGI
jgi:RimJ/RimL family protein N-acetyltransferase